MFLSMLVSNSYVLVKNYHKLFVKYILTLLLRAAISRNDSRMPRGDLEVAPMFF